MTKFEEFEKKFKYEYYSGVSEFMENNKINFTFVKDNTEENYDSYGNEDTKLSKIYFFPDFDIYVEFYGTRQSYNGTEWQGMREVKPIEKVVTNFEEVK